MFIPLHSVAELQHEVELKQVEASLFTLHSVAELQHEVELKQVEASLFTLHSVAELKHEVELKQVEASLFTRLLSCSTGMCQASRSITLLYFLK